MNKRYKNINLPIELVEEIDQHIEQHPELGYSSRAEFAKEAIRKSLREQREWETISSGKKEPE
ncbi:hypothetical protein C9439_01320 [archaeon SCG-AAA382B04]|nr:hypothetical protein C9439_01320 [archaeon SCG-AAA382B04]